MREWGDRRHVDVWIMLSVIIHRALNTSLDFHCTVCVAVFQNEAILHCVICYKVEVLLMYLEELLKNSFEKNGLTPVAVHLFDMCIDIVDVFNH